MSIGSVGTGRLRIAEIILDSSPTVFWDMLRQVGVEEVTGILPRAYPDWRQWRAWDPWDYAPLSNYKRMIEGAGFKLTIIEDNPPMDKLIYGLPGKEEQLNNVAKLIENMGKLGISTWVYNWMPTGWLRTRSTIRGRGGAYTAGFYEEDLKDSPPPKFGKIDASTLWRTLKDFLEYIIPIAESANVRLAMHPDDPPIPEVAGTARIMNSIEAFDKLLSLVKSEYNGITMCLGNFSLMTSDLPGLIRHFVPTGRVFFVHFRAVKGTARGFEEVFIDEAGGEFYLAMKEFVRHDFYGPFRVDHTPTLSGDIAQLSTPGYSALGRLHAIGFLQGLFKAAVTELKGGS